MAATSVYLGNTGGTGTPGGSDTQVQFNDNGSFGGDSGLTYNKTSNAITSLGGLLVSGAGVIDGAGDQTLLNLTAAPTGFGTYNLVLGNATAGVTHETVVTIDTDGTFALTADNGDTAQALNYDPGGQAWSFTSKLNVAGDIATSTGTIQAASYKSGDGSTGIDTTITTASLVGKTITVKDGLITGFA